MEGALAGDETSYAPYQEFVDKVIAASPYQISCRLARTNFAGLRAARISQLCSRLRDM